MHLKRPPRSGLSPFIKTLWSSDATDTERSGGEHRERVLPTGEMHLVFRLSEHPLRLYDGVADRRYAELMKAR